MILLVASSLALLVVFAGVKLLIQVNRETLGNLYKCAAWFFIISGFVILASTGACCIVMCFKYGAKMMHKAHKMMMGGEGHYMKGGDKSHKKMMKYHCAGQHEGCRSNMNCCRYEMDQCYGHKDVCKTDTMKCNKR